MLENLEILYRHRIDLTKKMRQDPGGGLICGV